MRQEGKIKLNFKINIVLNHSESITVMVVLHENKLNVSQFLASLPFLSRNSSFHLSQVGIMQHSMLQNTNRLSITVHFYVFSLNCFDHEISEFITLTLR